MANRFPEICAQRETVNTAELDLFLSRDLLWFNGHFEGFPILPGVVQLHWALHYANAIFQLGLRSASNHQVKFRSMIQPEQRVVLGLVHEPLRKRLKFEYRDTDQVYSSGMISLEEGSCP